MKFLTDRSKDIAKNTLSCSKAKIGSRTLQTRSERKILSLLEPYFLTKQWKYIPDGHNFGMRKEELSGLCLRGDTVYCC